MRLIELDEVYAEYEKHVKFCKLRKLKPAKFYNLVDNFKESGWRII